MQPMALALGQEKLVLGMKGAFIRDAPYLNLLRYKLLLARDHEADRARASVLMCEKLLL